MPLGKTELKYRKFTFKVEPPRKWALCYGEIAANYQVKIDSEHAWAEERLAMVKSWDSCVHQYDQEKLGTVVDFLLGFMPFDTISDCILARSLEVCPAYERYYDPEDIMHLQQSAT